MLKIGVVNSKIAHELRPYGVQNFANLKNIEYFQVFEGLQDKINYQK